MVGSLVLLWGLAGCRFDGGWEVVSGDPNCLMADGDRLEIDSPYREDWWFLVFESVDVPDATCTESGRSEWACEVETEYDLGLIGADAQGGSTLEIWLDRDGRALEGTVSLEHSCRGQDCAAIQALEPCGTDGTAPLRLERF